MKALGDILHELVEGSTTILANRKGELHDLVDDVVGVLIDKLTPDTPPVAEDVPAEAEDVPAEAEAAAKPESPATVASPVFQPPAPKTDGAAKP